MTEIILPAARTLWDTFAAYIDGLRAQYKEQRRINAERARIFQELDSCTDRELAELNISRADIPAIANGTYAQ